MSGDSLIERSKAFAHRVHGEIDHRRKYTDEPYAAHLEAVARLVEGVGGTPEMIAAAWLHDAVEDTEATFEAIERELGTRVATLVREVTDVSQPQDGNRATRKALDRAHLAKASPDGMTIKLADLVDNAQSILEHDPRFARTFMHEKKLLLDVLEEGNQELYAMASALVAQFSAGLEISD